jgi:hypothetical protein
MNDHMPYLARKMGKENSIQQSELKGMINENVLKNMRRF